MTAPNILPTERGYLIQLAAWLLSPEPTRHIDALEQNTHIGRRQFSFAQTAMHEVLRLKAIEIKALAAKPISKSFAEIFDAYVALCSTEGITMQKETATSLREAATMALEALLVLSQDDRCGAHAWDDSYGSDAIEALRARLALPDAEPGAWAISYTGADGLQYRRLFGHNAIGDYRAIDPAATSTPLYAAPQPAPVERKPLTDEQMPTIPSAYRDGAYWGYSQSDFKDYARAIEHAHGIKGAA